MQGDDDGQNYGHQAQVARGKAKCQRKKRQVLGPSIAPDKIPIPSPGTGVLSSSGIAQIRWAD